MRVKFFLLSLFLFLSACSIKKYLSDPSSKDSALKSACEKKRMKWNDFSQSCMTPEAYCKSLTDGSIWTNGTCLTPEEQCAALGQDYTWIENQCQSAKDVCLEKKDGYVWANSKCQTPAEACAEQGNAWKMTPTQNCVLKTFSDYCLDPQPPDDVKFTLQVMQTQAQQTSCDKVESWAQSQTVFSYNSGVDKLTDIGPFVAFTSIVRLNLTNNSIEDISPLSALTTLQDLDLQNNQIFSLDKLSGLVNLKFLYLGYNQIYNLKPLNPLVGLVRLELFGNQISDVTSLAGLVNLSTLYINGNSIRSIGPLINLHLLQDFSVKDNPISKDGFEKTPTNCPQGGSIPQVIDAFCRGSISSIE